MQAAEFAREVETHVRPQTFPLALRLLRPGEEPPPKARRPKRDFQVQIANCQAVSMARRYGWTIATQREDLSCVLTKVAYGHEPAVPYYSQGHCACGMYTQTLEAGARSEAATHRLAYGEYETLVMAPAARAAFEPQVYVVYGNPAQVLRLVTGALWKSGGAITSGFTGRLDCSDLVIRTLQTGEYQVILPCYGDRVFGHTEDHEMAFSLPAGRASELVDGLRGTHEGGIRYPIPVFLRFQPSYPPNYDKLEEIWRQGEDAAEGG